jgi:hypothetical protein
MSNFIRASKYRHVFCDNPRVEAKYTDFRLSTTTGEQNYIKANPNYFAVGLQVSGSVCRMQRVYLRACAGECGLGTKIIPTGGCF